jgi:hypothetical protein
VGREQRLRAERLFRLFAGVEVRLQCAVGERGPVHVPGLQRIAVKGVNYMIFDQNIFKLGLGIALVFIAACGSSTGTKVTAADASEFAEHTATRDQIRAKLGKPSSSQTGSRGNGGTQTCDNYTFGNMSAMSGSFESSFASFCYDDQGVLVSKTFNGTSQ